MPYRLNGKFVSKAVYEAAQAPEKPAATPLPEMIRNVPADDVTAMVERIETALQTRATWERANDPRGSHINMRKVANAFSLNRRLAAFLVVMGADPDTMLNKHRKSDKRSNLKGLLKVVALVDYITGKSDKLERVSVALFASTIIAAKRGAKWISATEQELILSDESIPSLSEELQQAIREYQHKYMRIEGDSRPQSCAFRTTYNNLNIYSIVQEDTDAGYIQGIYLDISNPVVDYLSGRWGLQ